MVALLLGVTGVKAKPAPTTTTLWESSYTDNIEISVANLVSGATITVYTTVKSSDTSDDRKLRIFYKTAGNDVTSFTDVSDWVELTEGQEYYSFTLTSSAYDILDDDKKSNQNLYIGANNKNVVTISKITMTTEATPISTSDNLLSENWTASWTAKTFAAQSSAKIGDVIRVQYTAYKDDATDWPWVQFYFMDGGGNNLVDPVAASKQKNAVTYFEFEIVSADVLAKIQTGGFSIKGDQFVLNSVKLLTYADSYDAVSITVGSEGVATYSNGSKDVQISACDALKAYYASAVAEGTVTLTELTGCIPANTGVMIYGAEGTYTVPVGTEGWPSITTNYLKATGDYSTNVTRSTAGTYHYIFAKKEGEDPAFYKLAEDFTEGGQPYHVMSAHKAYLETTTPAASRVAPVFDDGETTGIQELENSSIEELKNSGNEALKAYYNLNGQRVTNPKRGLYIVNGKKVIIK